MAEQDDYDEDLFADLYDGDDAKAKEPESKQTVPLQQAQSVAPVPAPVVKPEPPSAIPQAVPLQQTQYSNGVSQDSAPRSQVEPPKAIITEHGFTGTVGIKEDGKMFIGGLNWETTDESLHNYFSQFGEVLECTVMRDGATGRSRGFGFLTFKDPKTVNVVMVKEHFLDGKIRAIPRDEQERTSKIFVGGVSQDATERDFEDFFARFGRVVDATLMMDKDTGRPRGFGFVTFEGEAAVEATLAQPLEILGKPIEVKRAQPRGKTDEEEGGRGKFGRRNDRFGQNGQNDNQAQPAGGMNGMSPQVMAQYWQRMQQYFAAMQSQMAGGNMQQGGNMNMNMGGMGGMGMNPQMMQQMMAMQAQAQGQGQGVGREATGSPGEQMQQGSANGSYDRKFDPRRGNDGASPFEGSGYEDDSSQSYQSNRGGRGGYGGRTPQGQPSGQAPANAPTGPKNAGRPGANYRGGGRGGHRGYHPYSRN